MGFLPDFVKGEQMRDADKWVVAELKELGFAPYAKLLVCVENHFNILRSIEAKFKSKAGQILTKRQAVVFGLLARTFQLSISCLVNQLTKNHAGWNCSYRSLMETFFVTDWAVQDVQRLESFFENHTPVIGRIKADCCLRDPSFKDKYARASETTHVGTRSLHLPMCSQGVQESEIPFVASGMHIGDQTLIEMLTEFELLQNLLLDRLNTLLSDKYAFLSSGEVIWSSGSTKSKFGCLGYAPIDPSAGAIDQH